jgi:hypothetical protein
VNGAIRQVFELEAIKLAAEPSACQALENEFQDILEELIPPTQPNKETTDSLCAGAVGAPAAFERTVPTNWIKRKMTDAGYEMTCWMRND